MEGQTITERAARGLKGGIAAVINLAGFVWPARNKSITGDEEESTPPPPYQIWKDGIVTLLEDAKPLFFSDIPPEQAEIEFASLFRKQTIKSFRTLPQYVAADYQCPKTYVLSENDKSVPPEWQEKMAELGKHDIIRVSSGHASFLSIPEEIVAIITRVAESST
ncbi:hypothetical protein N7462_006512 [Penicillium macrosclerotiorum]|uniref:uncharacterized protein n=1 Tax=Penicillium macrosclerotiorum TaxID=303699 RepID=UPI002549B773|nr:uncharacterized protein N7462_006512 [Penicillium macrosclerotiorum]KAJ5683347.1 hypothetical protein N7462_006512 [Penicillium macrosclerotiorum]